MPDCITPPSVDAISPLLNPLRIMSWMRLRRSSSLKLASPLICPCCPLTAMESDATEESPAVVARDGSCVPVLAWPAVASKVSAF